MATVTSKDGTKIGFDKVGSGPAVILVNGAMSYRWAVDPTLANLAELMSKDFTVYNFDRRGRGESTDNSDVDTFTKEREIEDVQALIEDAGGEAMLVGFSSGSAVALETAAVTPGVHKVATYEIPFIVDDGREPIEDYAGQTTKLVRENKIEELLEWWLTTVVGMPAEFVDGMKQNPDFWGSMKAIAPTLTHDAAFMTEFMKGRPLPAGYWSKVAVPVLAIDGGASEAWMHNASDALAEQLHDATRATLDGQTHSVDANVLAPVIIDFFKK